MVSCGAVNGSEAQMNSSFAGLSSSHCPCRIREDYLTVYLFRTFLYILYVPAPPPVPVVPGPVQTDMNNLLYENKELQTLPCGSYSTSVCRAALHQCTY